MRFAVILPCTIIGLNGNGTLLDSDITRCGINSKLIRYIITFIISNYRSSFCCNLSAFINMCRGFSCCKTCYSIFITVNLYRDAAVIVFILYKAAYSMLFTIIGKCAAVDRKVDNKCSISAFSGLGSYSKSSFILGKFVVVKVSSLVRIDVKCIGTASYNFLLAVDAPCPSAQPSSEPLLVIVRPSVSSTTSESPFFNALPS